MRFIANENIPGPVVQALRDRAHDVLWVKERMPGADDRTVLALAQAEQRVVLTLGHRFRRACVSIAPSCGAADQPRIKPGPLEDAIFCA